MTLTQWRSKSPHSLTKSIPFWSVGRLLWRIQWHMILLQRLWNDHCFWSVSDWIVSLEGASWGHLGKEDRICINPGIKMPSFHSPITCTSCCTGGGIRLGTPMRKDFGFGFLWIGECTSYVHWLNTCGGKIIRITIYQIVQWYRLYNWSRGTVDEAFRSTITCNRLSWSVPYP